jgi:kynurenine formamidase
MAVLESRIVEIHWPGLNEEVEMVTEPSTGLAFVELSHEWGHYSPPTPGFRDLQVFRAATHATHGVLTQRIVTSMHHGTHLNAPIHLAQGGKGVGELPTDTFFGTGVVLDVPKGEWEYVLPEDLEAATQTAGDVQPGDFVVINTGWHAKFADDMDYFVQGPGLSATAAQWLRDKGAKVVAIDTAQVDHPLATSFAQKHRGLGPFVIELPRRYRQRTGREVTADFPDWNPAHRLLAKAGIPTIENVGGDVDAVTGQRAAFHALPWPWPEADACIIRFVAILDTTGDYRLERGA